MFTLEQQDRIDFEGDLVNMYLSDFRMFRYTSAFGFTGWVTPKTGSGSYELTLEATTVYEYVGPDLFVTSPHVLRLYGSHKSINSLGTTHAYHAYENGPDGCVKICHTSGWDPSLSCVQVLLKGIIYCEAHSIHLRTGDTIAKIIDSFEEYYMIWADPSFFDWQSYFGSKFQR